MYLTDFIKKEIDVGNGMCGTMLLDLQKAFDTVILLTKLMACGIDSTVLSWMTSCLSGLDQPVDVGGHLSKAMAVTCEVLHGSGLGPLLFPLLSALSHRDEDRIQSILVDTLGD